jgi:hypothetical protein
MTQQQRPMGVTILAVLAIIGGIFGICGGGLGILGGSFLGAVGAQAGVGNAAALGGMAVLSSLILLVIAVAEILFGIGALTLKPWAWMLGLVISGISIVFALLSLLAGWAPFFNVLIQIVISGIIIYYLMTPEVKQAFGRA